MVNMFIFLMRVMVLSVIVMTAVIIALLGIYTFVLFILSIKETLSDERK